MGGNTRCNTGCNTHASIPLSVGVPTHTMRGQPLAAKHKRPREGFGFGVECGNLSHTFPHSQEGKQHVFGVEERPDEAVEVLDAVCRVLGPLQLESLQTMSEELGPKPAKRHTFSTRPDARMAWPPAMTGTQKTPGLLIASQAAVA